MPVEPQILKNYVKLVSGVPKRLVLSDPVIEEITIRDPKTQKPKVIRRLRWTVLEEDGMTVTKYFTTPSEKLAQMLYAIWDKRTTDRICVIITEFGVELAKDYEVRPC
ncbi:MAG: hypothetical protein LM564_00125 [Desulfurococcaceae archaeon]|nr:hypothetical protein [Desulfurococcaceae archaeon]